MKSILSIIFILFNVIIVFCQATDETKYINYEVNNYQISFPKNFKFEKKEPLVIGLIEGGFYIVKDENDLIIIQLNVTNCERLGMGIQGLKNAIEKGKIVNKRKTNLDFEYDVIEYENGEYTNIEYIFCSNNLIYHLSGTYRTNKTQLSKPEVENIMNSFELK